MAAVVASHFSTSSSIHGDSIERGKSFEIFHVFVECNALTHVVGLTHFCRSLAFVRLLEFVEIHHMQKHREKVKRKAYFCIMTVKRARARTFIRFIRSAMPLN